MRSLMDAVREILVTVLVEQWYFGLMLDIIVLLAFVALLEGIGKAAGRPLAVAVGLAGLGLYGWLAVSLFGSYPGFSAALTAVGLLFIYFAYHAYFAKPSGKDKK